MPTYLVKKVHSMLAKNFNILPRSMTILKNDKAKFKAALRKFLHMRSFYSVDEFFLCKYVL